MNKIGWLGLALVLLAVVWPARAWALRCGNRIVKQGDTVVQVREECGDPFFVDRYAGPPGDGVDVPIEPGARVTTEAWYYNFGPQQLMVRLEFSGGVLARVQTLGYGFVGRGGPCDFVGITPGISVATLIARCGYPIDRVRNPLALSGYLGAKAPAWGETWFYPADGSRAAREVHLQQGRVTDIKILH